MALDSSSEVHSVLSERLAPLGFEAHPFLVGWYNELVADKFRLPHADNVLGFVLISRPCMFERTFLPFLMSEEEEEGKREADSVRLRGDPLDRCMRQTLGQVSAMFPPALGPVEVIHDFELLPNRRPRVLAQTAAHVAGAARFIRKEDAGDLLDSAKKVFPVCVHPRLGGWFAIRAVAIFSGTREPRMPRPPPPLKDAVGRKEAAELLRLYNDCWRDWRFRDALIKEPEERYSQLQREYFETAPADRWKIVKRLKEESKEKT